MKKRGFLVIRIFSIASILLFVLFLYLFLWHKKEYVGWEYAIATEQVGQFGDFIGGVIGTILSVVLLFFTLDLQREDSKNNSEIYISQQVNDEFFHLLDVYNTILNSLRYNENEYFGKVAIHKYVDDLYEGFEIAKINISRKKAMQAFQDFYAQEREFGSVYFRTLYRICEFIDKSDCSPEKKTEYMKILRAQFTDSELIMLRYNAMTESGTNFRFYINKYNLLKHIPIFLLLEYKEWRKQVTFSDAMKINDLLMRIKREMSILLKSNNRTSVTLSSYSRYKLKISCNIERTRIELELTRSQEGRLPEGEFSAIVFFSRQDLRQLLRFYMKDCFVLSSFNSVNKRKDLELNYEENVKNGVEYIKTWVENKATNKAPLKFVCR